MRLAFKIAIRFLFSNKGQTLLIILGIAVGVSVQIFIGSLIQGLQKGLVDKTIGSSSHITVIKKSDDKEIDDYNIILDKIKQSDSKIENISAASDHAAFMQYNYNSQSLLLRGFEFQQADAIYKFTNNMVDGTYPKNDYEIIIGVDLRDEYVIKLNDEIEITSFGMKSTTCKVVGFFDLKVSSINKNWGITTLSTAQSIFDTGDTVTSIEIQVSDKFVFEADILANNLSNMLNNNELKIENWKDQNGQLLSGLQGQSISSIMIQVFVLISVVLGIASVLAITVMQKSRQIGILKAMGINNIDTSIIFLFEGLILGILGALLGILFGFGLSFAFTKFALNPDSTPVVQLYISYSFYMLSGLIAVISSVLASLIPAIRSSRLNPIDIIRNN